MYTGIATGPRAKLARKAISCHDLRHSFGTLAVRKATSLSPDHSYFVVVLSVLLMHYYFDHFLFSQPRMIE